MEKTKHRNKAAMTPKQFVARAYKLLGKGEPDSVWRKRFCNITGYTQATVTRMIQGKIPVTEVIDSIFFMLELLDFANVDYLDEFGLRDV